MNRIVLFGAGFMGSAVGRSVRKSYPDVEIGIVEPSTDKRKDALMQFAGSDFSEDPASGIAWADLTVLAIKPQDLDRIGMVSPPPDRSYLSILAGTSIDRISETVGSKAVARMMPNLAADIGRAVVGLTVPPAVPENLATLSRKVAGSLGTVIEIPEKLMHAVTALSGSGIAFVFEMIHAMALGGVKEGLKYEDAVRGAAEVVASAGETIRRLGVNPAEMTSRVCSPAGTTIAGIEAMEKGGVRAGIIAAIHAAAERSRELES